MSNIILSIVKGKEMIAEDIYYGCNYKWFDNLQKRFCDSEYDFLPSHSGLPEGDLPQSIVDDYKKQESFYGFSYITAGEFCEWFTKYHPNLHAGWITAYEKWQLERKNIIPEDFAIVRPEDAVDEDMFFCEWEDKYDSSLWLYNYLLEHEVYADATIIYYFG